MSSDTPTRVRLRVPATSANLGPGFDTFGLALTLYDEVTVTVPDASGYQDHSRGYRDDGPLVEVEGEGAGTVPRDRTHLIVRSIDATFEHLELPGPAGLRIRCLNRIPHARGLGSSAAAIAAGVLTARALIPDGTERLPDEEALRLATRLEGHPDNVAACLLGGLTIAWSAPHPAAVRLEPADLDLVAYVPDQPMSTEQARGLLPPRVPHSDAAANAGRAGLLVGALTGAMTVAPTESAWLVATDDLLHQPYRAAAMPDSSRLVARLRDAEVPAVISGAGPTVLAFAALEDLDDDLTSVPGFRSFPLRIDRAGTTVEADLDQDTR